MTARSFATSQRMDDPEERGRRTGAFFKSEGRNYGKVNGHYPSNPYFNGSQEACAYDKGYEDGFNDR